MCQFVYIINAVRLTAKAVCSKSKFVAEAAQLPDWFLRRPYSGHTAAEKFLRPLYGFSFSKNSKSSRSGRSKCERDSMWPHKFCGGRGSPQKF